MLRFLLTCAFLAGGVYLCAVAGLYFAQRSLIFPAPKGRVAPPPGFEEVTYRTDDALELKAAYRRASPGMPTVVFFHGNGDNWEGAAVATAALAEAGYGVLLPEYRGYAGNPGTPSEAGLYRDGRAALGWLATQGIAPDRLVVIGNSIGSGVAVQMAVEKTPAALVLVSPLSSLPDLVGEKFRWLPARWLVRDRFDNRAKIGRVKAPVLLLHGGKDGLIPLHHAERLARVSSKARLGVFEDAGHELAYLAPAKAAMRDWLRAAAPGRGEAPRPVSAGR